MTAEDGEQKTYTIPYGSRLKVREGQWIEAGDEITQGSVNPHDILRIKGFDGVQQYLIKEVQRVYRLQGVDINDKHIEIIEGRCFVKVEDAGDTDSLPGGLYSIYEYEEEINGFKNPEEHLQKRKEFYWELQASLATNILSAASFQEQPY